MHLPLWHSQGTSKCRVHKSCHRPKMWPKTRRSKCSSEDVVFSSAFLTTHRRKGPSWSVTRTKWRWWHHPTSSLSIQPSEIESLVRCHLWVGNIRDLHLDWDFHLKRRPHSMLQRWSLSETTRPHSPGPVPTCWNGWPWSMDEMLGRGSPYDNTILSEEMLQLLLDHGLRCPTQGLQPWLLWCPADGFPNLWVFGIPVFADWRWRFVPWQCRTCVIEWWKWPDSLLQNLHGRPLLSRFPRSHLHQWHG